MKNYTPARQQLKKLGWSRSDRAGWDGPIEWWTPPSDPLKYPGPQPRSFESACKKAGVKIGPEDALAVYLPKNGENKTT